eukprot:c39117_g1_i1 orf=1-153(-)
MGAVTNSARIIECKIEDLLRIILDSMKIMGLSILDQSADRLGAHMGDAYII